MFQQIDLGVTLRSAADTFKEELVGTIITWLADMCRSTIGGDEDVFKRLLARALCDTKLVKGAGHGTPISLDLRKLEWDRTYTGQESKRIDWLMQLDVRLWKKAKWDLRSIYAGLYSLEWDVRKELGTFRQSMSLIASCALCLQLYPIVRGLSLPRSRYRHTPNLELIPRLW